LYDYNNTVHLAPNLKSKHEAVSALDSRLITCLDEYPALKLELDGDAGGFSSPGLNEETLNWARYTWAWKIASYRMKFHSLFLGRGMAADGLRYQASENICRSAAEILMRQRMLVGQLHRRRHEWTNGWRFTLDTVYAGVVFATLAQYSHDPTVELQLRSNAASILHILNTTDKTGAGRRGHEYLTKLLTASAQDSPNNDATFSLTAPVLEELFRPTQYQDAGLDLYALMSENDGSFGSAYGSTHPLDVTGWPWEGTDRVLF